MTTVNTNGKEKIFFRQASTQTTQFGDIIKIAFSKSDLENLIDKCNDKGWVNLDIKGLKNPTDKTTHSVSLNEYVKPTS